MEAKLELLQKDRRPGNRFPQTAGCKARACFVETSKTFCVFSMGSRVTLCTSCIYSTNKLWGATILR